jgi:hypothetical protein
MPEEKVESIKLEGAQAAVVSEILNLDIPANYENAYSSGRVIGRGHLLSQGSHGVTTTINFNVGDHELITTFYDEGIKVALVNCSSDVLNKLCAAWIRYRVDSVDSKDK